MVIFIKRWAEPSVPHYNQASQPSVGLNGCLIAEGLQLIKFTRAAFRGVHFQNVCFFKL